MRKQYLKPSVLISVYYTTAIICGSIVENGDKLNVTITNDNGTFDNNTINSRTFNVWDDEEDEE